jgi:hypothetical protein
VYTFHGFRNEVFIFNGFFVGLAKVRLRMAMKCGWDILASAWFEISVVE